MAERQRRAAGARRRGRRGRRRPALTWQTTARHAIEVAGVLVVALVAVIGLLGRAAQGIHGSGLFSHLVPFALVVLVVGIAATGSLWGWVSLRRWLVAHGWVVTVPVLAALLAAGALWVATRPGFEREVAGVRGWVGGASEAQRQDVAHQVFAAYRKTDPHAFERMLERSRAYEPAVQEAAAAFDVDAEVLMGVAAAESSFLPRDSADGGRGLFQITAPPATATAAAARALGVTQPDLQDPRQNAFVAAATLGLYLEQMQGDPYLGLLAYNIGPRNGGLVTIMRQYGARDFTTIQPYLQNLPRDYPIRVLSAALAYRLWRRDGRLPRYEEGDNALRIQRVGVPSLVPPAP